MLVSQEEAINCWEQLGSQPGKGRERSRNGHSIHQWDYVAHSFDGQGGTVSQLSLLDKILLSDPGNLGFHVITSLACDLYSGDVILLEKAEI